MISEETEDWATEKATLTDTIALLEEEKAILEKQIEAREEAAAAAVEQTSLSSARLLRTAQGLVRRRLWDEAAIYLEKTAGRASELSPDDLMTFRTLQAKTALGNDEIEQAAAILEAIVAEDPMNGQALLTLANLKREQVFYEEAAFAYEQAAKVDDTKVDALVEHARMLVGMRDYGCLVLPVCPGPTRFKNESTPDLRERILDLTTPASLAGRPALTIPIFLDARRSVGLQFVFERPEPTIPLQILQWCARI